MMKTTRRDFLRTMASVGIASSLSPTIFSQEKMINFQKKEKSNMIWANLIHLSTNMWEDHPYIKKSGNWPDIDEENIHRDDFVCKTYIDGLAWGLRGYRSSLVFDESVWNTLLLRIRDAGMNMVVIDLGDAIKYTSHPEIAVKNAWSVDKLRSELAKMRDLGLEPIPKLNFATTHDAWLGEYSRMVSTKKYYSVCSDLINEVIEIFDTPRFFHIGMDEETAGGQSSYDYAVVRQRDLYWHDLYFYIDEIEKNNVRAWSFSDYGWNHLETFLEKMPKSVLQSNWYYRDSFDLKNIEESQKVRLKMYHDLELHGFDQVPTGSNFDNDVNMEGTVAYCKNNIDSSRLKGFITTPWLPTIDVCLNKHKDAIDQIGKAKETYY